MGDVNDARTDPVLGASLSTAVDRVLERETDADREAVRAALSFVAADDAVTEESVTAAVGDVAQHVATPENRLDMARDALADARAAAEPVGDLPIVDARLAPLVEAFDGVEADVESLCARLEDVVERSAAPADVYTLATDARELRWDVREVHGDVEGLLGDLEAFERWATTPRVRVDELVGDVTEAEEYAGELDDAVAALEDGELGGTDPALAWADAAIQRRVLALLIADLRAELAQLQAWAERDGVEADGETSDPTVVADRIDALGTRESALAERIETVAREPWRERAGDRVRAAADDLAAIEPPVDWGAVEAVLTEHREALAAEVGSA